MAGEIWSNLNVVTVGSRYDGEDPQGRPSQRMLRYGAVLLLIGVGLFFLSYNILQMLVYLI